MELYVLGDLSVKDAMAVKEHLHVCRRCLQESAEIAQFIRIFRLRCLFTRTSGPRQRMKHSFGFGG